MTAGTASDDRDRYLEYYIHYLKIRGEIPPSLPRLLLFGKIYSGEISGKEDSDPLLHLLQQALVPEASLSVVELAKEEKEFYAVYSSLESVELKFWQNEMAECVTKVQGGPDSFQDQDLYEKIKILFDTFICRLKTNRSIAQLRFSESGQYKNFDILRDAREEFFIFTKEVLEDAFQKKQIPRRSPVKCIQKFLLEGISVEDFIHPDDKRACKFSITHFYSLLLWMVFIRMLKFNMTDTSEDFQDTGDFTENILRPVIDLMRKQLPESVWDLAKTLLHGKKGCT